MSLDQHIDVTLVVNNAGVTGQGFGTIARISWQAPWTDASRTYRRASDAVNDGFASDSPEVLFLSSVFRQSPKPATAKILRGTRPPTIQYTMSATPVATKAYAIGVTGQGVTPRTSSVTSDSSPTAAKIHNAIVTDLNTTVGKNFTAAFAADAFADFTYTVPVFGNGQLHAVAHGRQTGSGPIQLLNSGGAQPGGTLLLTNYWLIRVGPDDLKLATSLANALAGTSVTLSDAGTGTQTIQHQAGTLNPSAPFTVTANTAGAYFALAVANTSILSVAQTHSDPGIASDLNDAVTADSDWYYLSIGATSSAINLAALAWVEGQPFKTMMAETQDSACENSAVGSGDVMDLWKGFSYKRSVLGYHRKPAEMWTDGWTAGDAALPVGKWTPAYKTVIGASADSFTATQTTNLDAKRGSYYKSEAGTSLSWEGKVSNTSYGFFDVTVALDFVLQLIQLKAFSLLKSLPKLPYTDEGIAAMTGAVGGAIDICKSNDRQIVAPGIPGDPNDPEPSVSFPLVRNIDPGDRSTRVLPPGDVFFRLQSAMHKVDINLTVIF